ncbi:MAG: flagellar hook-basal body complex protein FliE [Liquorilactobacillus nagelii]|jgi:flagellar hook-basal body complex protein FliE|uniref:flagellar hook-basal body complex protein FliE n=1 Tax=Liquorilactobacillus nagelii TaxID=82688 RepID=UPI00242F58C0|nr:flagellar hook-basal body complex protein FliE [Liquorilactobacillus nagelii]MCI1633800.1 flagellar hook-basal body complex protein FliE [Liquorilactobacillus nagelii]
MITSSIGAVNLQNYQKSLEKLTGFDQSNKTNNNAVAFGNYLDKAVSGVNQKLVSMDNATDNMISGNSSDLGNVMVKMTEAQLSMETAVQVRNKLLDAYNDIKNMQF